MNDGGGGVRGGVRSGAFEGSSRLSLGALVVGVLGLALFAVGVAIDPRQAYFSYLSGYAYGLSLAVGALFFLMIGHVTGAGWFVAIRRLTEAVAAALPVFALLFVPLLFGLDLLYPWARPIESLTGHVQEAVQHKRPYLNVPFFVGRAALYFAVWIALGELLRRWSIRQDTDGDDGTLASRQRVLSAGGLPVLALTLTFAAFDWLMSLEPGWYSTVFGVYYFAGGFVSTLALVIIVTLLAKRSGLLPEAVAASHFHALGKLLLTFVVFWAYIAFVQFFLIWIGNIPEEITWYLVRTSGTWMGVGVFLAVGHFALPFFLLLSRSLKRRPEALAAVAAWIVFVHYVDVHWLVLPALHEEGLRPHWLDASATVGVLGAAVACGVWRLGGHATVPLGDPRLETSLRYRTS